MPSFKDNKDRPWELMIDAPAAMKIRAEWDAKFLLNDGAEDNTYTRLATDPVLLCGVVYLLCEKQRKEREISDEDFYLQVMGDAIDRATEAMLAAIVNFTPARTREILQAVASLTSMQAKAVEMTLEKITDPATQEMFIRELSKKLDIETLGVSIPSANATPSPDSAESIPPT